MALKLSPLQLAAGSFVAGAALQGLRRTGQSSRHDAFFMSETMRAELHAKRAACMDMGNPK